MSFINIITELKTINKIFKIISMNIVLLIL